ncbi:DUF4097 family beta strand repeat-containing protein [Gracilimonas sp.]|uniref:DUF4097 family beta strand repeat-containing protein n=1 Tax=Gracilimonas sp. TaxID=1974203 RepID=UPI003D0AB38C
MYRPFKKLLFILTVGLISIPALAQNNLEIPLSNPGEPGKLIVAANFSDEVEIRAHDKNNVIVNYDSDHADDERDAMRNGMRRISGGGVGIEVTEDNNEVRVNTGPMPNDDLEMIIYVPRNFSLKLNTVQGDVTVSGLSGELEISAVNGDVELSDISGTVLVNSVNGDIEIDFNEITANAPMSFTGVNGDIEVSFPADAKFTAKMKTEWGDVYTNFDMEIDRNSSKPEVNTKDGEYRVAVNKWIFGKVNGGGPEFLFKTLHGDISIRKK